MGDFYRRLEQAGPEQDNYSAFYNVSHRPSPLADPRRYRAYWCGMGRAEPDQFAACCNSAPKPLTLLLGTGP
jgi:hypothetical protein